MARQTNLAMLLGADDQAHDEAVAAATPAQDASPAPQKRATRPRRKGGQEGSRSARKTAQKRSQAAKKAAPAPADTTTSADADAGESGQSAEGREPRVLAVDAGSAKRVSLYLHPDDFRALGMAKLDDGADINARIRSLIAVYRHNARVRAQVDRLARTAPRGGMP